MGWGALTVTVGLVCPLTTWEDALRRLGDEDGLPRGFIDTYLTGVVYPQEYLPAARLLVAALIVVSWVGLAVAPRRSDSAGWRIAGGPAPVRTGQASEPSRSKGSSPRR